MHIYTVIKNVILCFVKSIIPINVHNWLYYCQGDMYCGDEENNTSLKIIAISPVNGKQLNTLPFQYDKDLSVFGEFGGGCYIMYRDSR